MEKDARVTFGGWLVFAAWLVIARWQGLHSAADNLLQWRLWFLFGGFLLLDRRARRYLRIVVAAISETTEHSIPGAPVDTR
jgi:hypothetical protein